MSVCSSRLYGLLSCLLVSAVGCSGAPNTSESLVGEAASYGSMRVALQTTSGSHAYALRQATFELDGAANVTIQTDDESTSSSVEATLPSGNYTLELLDGWQLLQLSPDGDRPLEATLSSPNPQQLVIGPDETTSVQLAFSVSEDQIVLGEGQLEITFAVDVASPKTAIFTEFMLNPEALPDSEGEWFEIINYSSRDFDLQGCSVARADSGFVVDTPLVLQPGQAAVFSNGENPGFTPSFVYSSLTLPNTPDFTISLECDSQIVDSVTMSGVWAPPAGASLALDPAHETPQSNDAPDAWCASTDPFGEDLGTPGAANPTCSSDTP